MFGVHTPCHHAHSLAVTVVADGIDHHSVVLQRPVLKRRLQQFVCLCCQLIRVSDVCTMSIMCSWCEQICAINWHTRKSFPRVAVREGVSQTVILLEREREVQSTFL